MQKATGYISSFTALLLLIALVYPYIHIFEHNSLGFNTDFKEHSHQVQTAHNLVNSTMDCKICDFHFSGFDHPELFYFDSYIPLKETVYSLSLIQTAWSSPDPYFSLRAPPIFRA